MATTKMLKVSSTEIVMLETLLEEFNLTNPNEVLLKMSSNILSNIKNKKNSYSNEFEDKKFIELSNDLKALIKGDYSAKNINLESKCNTCQYHGDNNCTKIKNQINYWGEEDAIRIIQELKNNECSECSFYDLKKVFEIQNIFSDKGNCCIEVKITQGLNSEIIFHTIKEIEFYIYKYGMTSFINIEHFQNQIDELKNKNH